MAFPLQNYSIEEKRGVIGFVAAPGFNETRRFSLIIEIGNRKDMMSSFALPRQLDEFGVPRCLTT